MRPPLLLTALLSSIVLIAIACSTNYSTVPSSIVERELADLQANTARFSDTTSGITAGWSTRVTDCMTDPTLGGMGVHYADAARLDTTVDVTRPEVLVYAPQNGAQGGPLRLVAVEYAVPLDAWKHPEPPRVLGQPFHVNADFGLWVLHAWVQQPNPSGVFSDWNPNVSCPPVRRGTASSSMAH